MMIMIIMQKDKKKNNNKKLSKISCSQSIITITVFTGSFVPLHSYINHLFH